MIGIAKDLIGAIILCFLAWVAIPLVRNFVTDATGNVSVVRFFISVVSVCLIGLVVGGIIKIKK